MPTLAAGLAIDPTALLDAWQEPAALIGLDHRVLAANAPYRRIFGGGGDPVGRTCHEVSHGFALPCDLAGEACPISQARRTGQPARLLHVHHTRFGDEHEQVVAFPIRDAAGDLVAFLETIHPTRGASVTPEPQGLIGRSPKFNQMLELVQRVAPCRTTVLLLGESGTGKELVARAIHDLGPCPNSSFVPVDCSGLAETLFESELFGHERGAFTGATHRKIGLVEAAEGGTLFLDEVGDISLGQQVKLLRLLETGSYRRVGSAELREADFRLVCATHRDLEAMVEDGSFRADLYYRISIFPIELPPLRERRDDIALLAEAMLRRVDPRRKRRLADEAVSRLEAYDFPGNARELLNLLERASILADGDVVLPDHLPERVGGGPGGPCPDEILPLAEMERRYLRWCAAVHRGSRRELAERLGLSERSLYRRLEGAELRAD